MTGATALPAAAPPRSMRRALSDPSPDVRRLAVAVLHEDGTERAARVLATHLSATNDPVVRDAARELLAGRGWPSDGPWGDVLRSWCACDPPPAADDAGRHASGGPEASDVGTPCAARRSGMRRLLVSVVAASVLAAVVAAVGGEMRAFPSAVTGYDAWAHQAKIAMLQRAWPHISLLPAWYGGVPTFRGSSPPAYHLLAAALVAMLEWTPAAAIHAIAFASLVVAVVSSYGVVRVATGKAAPGFVAGALVVASPALWGQVIESGDYPRLLAVAFLGVAMMATVGHLRRPSRLRLVASSTALAAVLATDVLLGVFACVLVGLLVLVATGGWWLVRVCRAAAIGGPAAGLAAVFYLPYALLPRPQAPPLAHNPLFEWAQLVVPVRSAAAALPAALLPLTVVGAVVVMWRLVADRTSWPRLAALRRHLRNPAVRWTPDRRIAPQPPAGRPGTEGDAVPIGLLSSCGVVGVGLLVLAALGHAGLRVGLPTATWNELLVYSSWMLAVCIGVGLAIAPMRLPVYVTACVVTLAAALGSLVPTIDCVPAHVVWSSRAEAMREFPAEAASRRDYRIAAFDDAQSDWLGVRYDTPEVRGPHTASVAGPDWQAWIDAAVHDPRVTREERAFLFDWWSVRWLWTSGGGVDTAALLADPAYSTATVDTRGDPAVLRYTGSTPIVTATRAPAVLVVGTALDYEIVLRALAASGADSTVVVPVYGGETIDGLPFDELKRFDSVLLYGYGARDWRAGSRLLTSYVDNGGRLVVDDGDTHYGGKDLPRLLPVRRAVRAPVVGDWDLTSDLGAADAASLDPTGIAPPRFDKERPWEVMIGRTLSPDAVTVVASHAKPLIVAADRGRGHVVWSGMNLPFHAASFHSDADSRLLVGLLGVDVARRSENVVSAGAGAINPERWDVAVAAGARGVLVKQDALPEWRAMADGRARRVFLAGPGFMYVPVDGAGRVTLRYGPTTAERAGAAVSLATAAAIVVLLGASGVGALARRVARVRGR